MSAKVKQKTSEYPKVLRDNSRGGTKMVQIDERTVMVGNLEMHLVPEELIEEQGTGRWIHRNPFDGLRWMRYEFMLEKMPLEAQRMDFSGEMEEYLTWVAEAWKTRVHDIVEDWMNKEIASGTLPEDEQKRTQEINYVNHVAREIANHEYILNMDL